MLGKSIEQTNNEMKVSVKKTIWHVVLGGHREIARITIWGRVWMWS